MDKKTLRATILQERAKLSNADIIGKSEKIANILYENDHFINAKRIMSFVSSQTEVNTHDIIKHSISIGKSVTVPFTHHHPRHMKASEIFDMAELEIGYYNILAPKKEFHRFVDNRTLDLILVPGVALATNGYRVGYGGGYYDRFMTDLRPDTLKIALVFDLQIVDKVPIDDFDIPVDYIITEKELIKCK